MSKITIEQFHLINSLRCERLTSNIINKELILRFENHRNNGLAESLRQEAWSDDAEGNVNYYLIKDTNDNILFFFSLKCGALFHHLNEEQIQYKAKLWNTLESILKNPDTSDPTAMLIIEKLRTGKDVTDEDLIGYVGKTATEKRNLLTSISKDRQTEKNGHIVRVDTTHSGVELVHFCKNDNCNVWSTWGLPQSLGNVVFWHFIVPLFENVQKIVGCKYAFLFAADLSEDGSLINYYQTALHFDMPKDIGTNKPIYDLSCRFMCQTVNTLVNNRVMFFEDFNPDRDSV